MEKNNFSKYRNIKSIVHSIDPITKLLGFMLIVISMFVAQEPGTLLVVFGFSFIVSLLSKVRIKSYFTSLLVVIPFFVIMFLFYLLLYSLNQTLIFVFMMSLRLYLFILLSIIYTSTTKEMDIALSIEWFITPLRVIKVPTYEISMMIMLSIRFIPLLFEDIRKIMIAQTSRGINVINGNLKARIKGISNSLLPMFVIAFKRSDDVAKAMVIRGYKIGNKRSKFRKNKFFILEWITLFTTISLLVVIILMTQGIIPGAIF
ncbi:MAG: energy-coupling factor transporter transmembrane protein EcfT [Mycoplasmataceae bacterium]|nr:energy-coupling factor transporter transmembrane protein EcfT [Mycoplasmataceae bacterium]